MKGVNCVVLAGNVGGQIVTSTTSHGRSALSFKIAIGKKKDGVPVWVRVNVYDEFADMCKTLVEKGGYVVIEGELMNRSIGEKVAPLVEVRGKNIVVLKGHENNNIDRENCINNEIDKGVQDE